jgi:hypothetical protein
MAMGKRKQRLRQSTIWIATSDLPRTAAHPFYEGMNRILDKAGSMFMWRRCAHRFTPSGWADPVWRRVAIFACSLSGTLKGWTPRERLPGAPLIRLRCANFWILELVETPPDHSTISRTRRLIDLETHREVFTWILKQLAEAGLVKDQTLGMDATTLEANAALRSIVRRDTVKAIRNFSPSWPRPRALKHRHARTWRALTVTERRRALMMIGPIRRTQMPRAPK